MQTLYTARNMPINILVIASVDVMQERRPHLIMKDSPIRVMLSIAYSLIHLDYTILAIAPRINGRTRADYDNIVTRSLDNPSNQFARSNNVRATTCKTEGYMNLHNWHNWKIENPHAICEDFKFKYGLEF